MMAVSAASLAVVALSSAGAVAAGSAPHTHHAARPVMSRQLYDPVGANGVAQSELLRTAQRVTSALPRSVLAGVSVHTGAGTIDVYVARSAPGGAAAVRAAVPAGQRGLVRVHRVRYSQTALDAYMARTGSVAGRLAAARVPVQAWWRNFTRGVIVVSLYRPTPAQRRLAAHALRGLPVRLTSTATAIAPIPAVTTRAAAAALVPATLTGKNRAQDARPWTGGDFIDSTYGGLFHLCTDSWPIKIGTTLYVTTAGHCSPAGHKWINMTLNKNHQPVGDRKLIGTGTKNELSGKHVDAQLLPASNVPFVWSGQLLKNYRSAVQTHLIPPVGIKVCNDGAYEGTVCGAKVIKSHYDSCVATSVGTMCHLYMAQLPAGHVLVGEGDSGGPDYVAVVSGGRVTAAKGVGLNSLETVANLSCKFFTWRGKVCSNAMLFTGLTAILKSYGASLRVKK
jgi:hypothetical protein